MTIDSHVHFWKYDPAQYAWIDDTMKVLQQDYLPEAIAQTLRRNGIDGCVAIQAATEEVETRFLAELAASHELIRGVVGWTDFRASDLGRKLDDLQRYPALRGMRHIVQSEPDDFLYDRRFREGIALLRERNLTYDVLIFARQLPAAVNFCAAFPDQVFILDHAAKPDIRNREIEQWKAGIRELAAHPHLYCKISGLLTETHWKQWSPGDFYPYLDVLFEYFGPDRLLFGSDWPVMLLSGIYVQWKSLIEKYMEPYAEEDRAKVFGGNAVRVYSL